MTGRRRRGPVSIRFRLGLALAVALLPVLALGGIDTYQAFRRDAGQRRASLMLAAERSAMGARARVRGATSLLEALSNETVGLACAPRLAEAMAVTPGYDNLVRLDVNGRVACAAARVGPDPARYWRSWFQRLVHGEAVTLAQAPPGVYSPNPAVLTAVRVGSGKRFDGAMLGVIRLDTLRPDLSDPGLPTSTEVAILNADGRPVMATRPGAFAPPPLGWRERALSPTGLAYEGRAPGGAMRIQAITPLLDRGAFVLLSAPARGLLSWARLNPFGSLFLPVLAWLLAWSSVWFVTERVVTRWLAYLDRIAAIYATGRFTVRPVQAENAPGEIRSLARTLDLMADGLTARDLSLQQSLAQKDTMMREIHHRVKNNLQVITSLLNMQQRSLTDPAARAAMSDTRQRINALALIYRALYQSPDLRTVDVRQFLEELTAQLGAGDGGSSRVRTELDADDLEIDPDKLAPLALFAVEAITNARKHAFDGRDGLIVVTFRVGEREIVLDISDDGRGVEDEIDAAAGVGRTLMSAFARQLRGAAEIGPGPEGGVRARLVFPNPGAPAIEAASAQLAPGNQAAA